jgi:hypothetical protein
MPEISRNVPGDPDGTVFSPPPRFCGTIASA